MHQKCSNEILFEFYRGDSYSLKVDICDTNGNPIDIRDKEIKITLKKNLNLPDNKASLKFDTGILNDADAQLGVAYLDFTSEQTSKLNPGSYYFDVQYQHYEVASTIIMGKMRVLADVTRRIN